jgi:hypothetical protein
MGKRRIYSIRLTSFFHITTLDKVMNYITLKVGKMEINYGHVHFRKTDNGMAFQNPFIGIIL